SFVLLANSSCFVLKWPPYSQTHAAYHVHVAAERTAAVSEMTNVSSSQAGTAEGLMQFLDYLITKGYGPQTAISPWKSAVAQIFMTVEGTEDYGQVDIADLDLDDYLHRFEMRSRGKYKVESLQAYRNRFTKAVESYREFISTGHLPTFRSTSRRGRRETATSTSSLADVTLAAATAAHRASTD